MAISVPKSIKGKDKMKMVEEYLFRVHHGYDTETPSTPSGVLPVAQTLPKSVNDTIKDIPPLLRGDQSDTTSASDDEDWSDDQPDTQYAATNVKKPKKAAKPRKRFSINTKHKLHFKAESSLITAKTHRKKEIKSAAVKEAVCNKQDEVEKLSTALNTLQAKFIEQAEEYKKSMESLLQAHAEERQRCEKLEKELVSQKHCLDILLEESHSTKNSKAKKRDSTSALANQENKNLKSEIDALKSELKDMVEQTAEKSPDLESLIRRIDKNQQGLEKLRAAHKKREKEPAAALEKADKTLGANELDHPHTKTQKAFDDNQLDKAPPSRSKTNSKSKEQVRERVEPMAVNIIIKAGETGGPETFIPVKVDQSNDSRKIDINLNVRSQNTSSLPIAKDHTEELSIKPRRDRTTKADKSTDTNTLNKTNSTVGPGNDPPLSLSGAHSSAAQRKETIKLTDHSRPTPGSAQKHVLVEETAPAASEPPEPARDSYRRTDDNSLRRNEVRRGSTWKKEEVDRPRADSNSRRTSKSFQRRKCLLIHDSTFDGFSQEYFSNQFDVTTFPVKKASIAAKSQRLKDLITLKAPECIYVHLGLHDIISTSVDKTLCHFEELREFFIHSTKANICFSLVVPTVNSPSLNSKIEELNKELSLMVSTARNDNAALRDQLFTYDNSSVGWLNERHDQNVQLTERGKMVMWTKLNDGFRKTLRLQRPNLTHKDRSNTLKNRLQYR